MADSVCQNSLINTNFDTFKKKKVFKGFFLMQLIVNFHGYSKKI